MTTISTQMPQTPITKSQNCTRYSDAELLFFKKIIESKIIDAGKRLKSEIAAASNSSGNGTEDTAPQFKSFDEGSKLANKELSTRLAIRQQRFIRDLKNALIRIGNRSYGICNETGELIPKDRLKLVPHATLSIEGKKIRNEREERERNSFIPKTA